MRVRARARARARGCGCGCGCRSAFPWLHYKELSEVEDELLQAQNS